VGGKYGIIIYKLAIVRLQLKFSVTTISINSIIIIINNNNIIISKFTFTVIISTSSYRIAVKEIQPGNCQRCRHCLKILGALPQHSFYP